MRLKICGGILFSFLVDILYKFEKNFIVILLGNLMVLVNICFVGFFIKFNNESKRFFLKIWLGFIVIVKNGDVVMNFNFDIYFSIDFYEFCNVLILFWYKLKRVFKVLIFLFCIFIVECKDVNL